MGVVFDIDDTLFFEKDYVISGFKAIGEYCAILTKIPATTYSDFLITEFHNGIRGDAFNRLLEKFPQLDMRTDIEKLVKTYREHMPQIPLVDGMAELIKSLYKEGLKLGAISDGPLISQHNKATALKIEKYFDPVILTDKWGKLDWKPSTRSYKEIEHLWDESGKNMIYIGDNPLKDFLGANKCNWQTVRLRLPEQLRYNLEPPTPEHAPKYEVDSIDALGALLRKLVQA